MQKPTAFRYDVSLAWPGNFQIEAQLKLFKVFDPKLNAWWPLVSTVARLNRYSENLY